MTTLTLLANEHISGYTEQGQANKILYHRLAKKYLRRIARALGLTAKNYRLSTNMAGIAVCGETTLHTDNLYVEVSQSCIGRGHEILFRTCKGRKDYSGGFNNFAPASALEAGYETFLARLKDMAGLTVIY